MAKKMFLLSFITNKTERISFKSGCVVLVGKHLKGDWLLIIMAKNNFVLLLKSFTDNVQKHKVHKF